MKKSRLIMPMTFIDVAAPTALDTSSHTHQRRFRLVATFIDVFNISAWLQVLLGGIKMGDITVTTSTAVASGTWGDGSLWGFSEDG